MLIWQWVGNTVQHEECWTERQRKLLYSRDLALYFAQSEMEHGGAKKNQILEVE